jgi:hypothetical protein
MSELVMTGFNDESKAFEMCAIFQHPHSKLNIGFIILHDLSAEKMR